MRPAHASFDRAIVTLAARINDGKGRSGLLVESVRRLAGDADGVHQGKPVLRRA